MTTTLDAEPHAEAIKAAIKADLGPREVYEYDEVPGTNDNPGVVPDMFAIVSVEMVEPANARMTGQTAVRRWIVTVRGVGRTVGEARWILARSMAALFEKSLVVEETPTSRLRFQSGQAPEHDDGRYSGLAVFTYAH